MYQKLVKSIKYYRNLIMDKMMKNSLYQSSIF